MEAHQDKFRFTGRLVQMNASIRDGGYLVSVIIPIYNRTDLLLRAVNSVLNQTYDNLEIIVVDDGSTEEIEGVLDTLDDDRIHYIRQTTNSGVSTTRNVGIRLAHGEYVAFLDSDDEWFEHKIERQLSDLIDRGEDYQISYHAADFYKDADSRVVGRSTFDKEGNILQYVLEGNCVGIVTMFMKRDYVLSVGGFDERFRGHEDWEFLIRLAEYYKFRYVDEMLARIHIHKGSKLSREYDKYAHYRKLLYDRHRRLYEDNRKAHAYFLSELASFLMVPGSRFEAQRLLLKSIALNPFRIDPYLRTALLYKNLLRNLRD
jgi:glycosyltransferase involved in cell wall biosynthesis